MVLVFDLGGTKTRVAVSENGKLGEVYTWPTDSSKAGFAKLLGVLQEVAGGKTVSAVAGGVPGQLRGEAGEFVVGTNLPEWRGLLMGDRLRELFDCPVWLANDVELGGLGESHYGAGTTEGVMVYYTVSTGVNAVRLVHGEIDPTIGRYELGFQRVGDGLELEIGGAAMQKRLGRAPGEVKDPAVWRAVERQFAVAIYNTMLFWNPGVIVCGGSMMRDISLDNVRTEFEKWPSVYESWPKLVRSKLGSEVGLYGGLVTLERLGYK